MRLSAHLIFCFFLFFTLILGFSISWPQIYYLPIVNPFDIPSRVYSKFLQVTLFLLVIDLSLFSSTIISFTLSFFFLSPSFLFAVKVILKAALVFSALSKFRHSFSIALLVLVDIS